jgi:hypothetical protein
MVNRGSVECISIESGVEAGPARNCSPPSLENSRLLGFIPYVGVAVGYALF